MLRIAQSLIPPRITTPVIIRFGRLINLKPNDINIDLNEKMPYTTMAELEQIRTTEDVRHNLTVLDGKKYIDLLTRKDKARHVPYYAEIMTKSTALQTDLEHYMTDSLDADSSVRANILSDLSNCTMYTRGMEDWDITHLAKQYQLQSEDVFNTLVEDAEPFGMGAFSHSKSRESDFKCRVEYALMNKSKYVHIDYWNGIGVKSSFPVNLDDPTTPLKLAIRRYNDRNGDTGYRRIVKMLYQNMSKRVPEYSPVLPDQPLKPVESEEAAPEYKPEWDTAANESITVTPPTCEYDNAYWIWKYAMENRKANYYNHRHHDHGDEGDKTSVWPFMMQPLYDRYIKGQSEVFTSLAYMFNFGNNRIESVRFHGRAEFNKVSIVNMLIYGRVNVNMTVLERILPLIRYRENSRADTIQLDNYEIQSFMYSNLGQPRYVINWKDDNIPSLKFAKTDAEKLLVCKALARLMNEVPPELLNFNNYYHVCAWAHCQDLAVQTIDYLTTTEDS